jgi:hypothetical protein
VYSKPGFCTVWQRQQMVVALYRETFEPALIEVPVPDRPVRNSPAHGVRVREPTEIVRQLTVLLRPRDKCQWLDRTQYDRMRIGCRSSLFPPPQRLF